MSVTLEICVDDPEGLEAAIAGGADRIELCSALDLGGLTPTAGLIAQAAKAPIPVYAMIRPRAGNFTFAEADITAMLAEIDAVRAAGLAGVVLGASHADGRLDGDVLGRLVRHSAGLGMTLHRAFDLVPDVDEAMELAVSLGFERILTSGGEPTALAGAERLRATHAVAAGRIGVMPGSGVKAANLDAILAIAPFAEVHSSCSGQIAGLGGRAQLLGFEEPERRVTNQAAVAELKRLCLSK